MNSGKTPLMAAAGREQAPPAESHAHGFSGGHKNNENVQAKKAQKIHHPHQRLRK